MIVVAFDLDDTLIPEVLFIKSGIRHIASLLCGKFTELPYLRIVGSMDQAVMTRRNHYSALESILEEFGLRNSLDMKEIVAEFRNHIPDASIYHLAPSVADVLTGLKTKGVKMALITDGRSTTQRNKIEASKLDLFFDQSDILISEETGHDKFQPDNFLEIMRKFEKADEFHYVGDNPKKDFIQPLKLGWKTHLVHDFPLAIHRGLPKN